MLKHLALIVLVSFVLNSGPALAQNESASQSPPCHRFEHCLHSVLSSQEPLAKVVMASEALKLWNQSIPKRDLINLLTLRGEALLRLHEQGGSDHLNLLEHAEADFRRFMEQDPKHWLPYAKLGRIFELRQEAEPARRHYDQAAKSDQPLALFERAAYYLRQNTLPAALADLDRAIQKNQAQIALERGLRSELLAPIYLMRAEVNRLLNRAMAAEMDQREACKLGLKEACETP